MITAAISGATVLPALLLLFLRGSHYPLSVQSQPLLAASALAGIMSTLQTPLLSITGLSAHSCDAIYWLAMLTPPLFVTPILVMLHRTRLVLEFERQKHRWAEREMSNELIAVISAQRQGFADWKVRERVGCFISVFAVSKPFFLPRLLALPVLVLRTQMIVLLLEGLAIPMIVTLVLFFAVDGSGSGLCTISDRLNAVQVVYTVAYAVALGVLAYRSGSAQGLVPFVALYITLMTVYTGFAFSYPIDHYTASKFDFSYLLWIMYAVFIVVYVLWPALNTFDCMRGHSHNEVTGKKQIAWSMFFLWDLTICWFPSQSLCAKSWRLSSE